MPSEILVYRLGCRGEWQGRDFRLASASDTFVTPLGLPVGVAGLQFQPHYRRISHDGQQSSFAAGLPPSLLPMANARTPASSGQYGGGNQQPTFSGARAAPRFQVSIVMLARDASSGRLVSFRCHSYVY